MAKSKTYTHDFDIKFSVESKHRDPDDIPLDQIARAFINRVSPLLNEPELLYDSYGHVETFDSLGKSVSKNLF